MPCAIGLNGTSDIASVQPAHMPHYSLPLKFLMSMHYWNSIRVNCHLSSPQAHGRATPYAINGASEIMNVHEACLIILAQLVSAID